MHTGASEYGEISGKENLVKIIKYALVIIGCID